MRRMRRAAVLAPLFAVALAAMMVPISSSGSAATSPAAIALNPVCGASGGDPHRYSIAVDGTDFNPLLDVVVTFDAASGGHPESFKAVSDGFGHFQVTITPLERAAGSYLVRADDLRERAATSPFVVPCPPTPQCTAAIALNPALAPAGGVVTLSGSSFPPQVHQITVGWDRGIDDFAPISVTSGNVAQSVLILPHDLPGPRTLHVTGSDAPSTNLSCARAPFLVVPGSLQPSDFVVRR